MGLSIERWYPWVLAIAGGWAWHHFSIPFPPDEKEFLAAAISLGAILTGFVATAQAILTALPSDSAMGRIRSSGYIRELVVYLAQALYGCLVFSVLCLVGFFVLGPTSPLHQLYTTAFCGLAIFAITSFQRVASVLFKILHYQPPSRDE
ncbi:hypothetical protein [Burkholderia gladioli]|uniref:hypothetical protein n=1 Tax=Burkholderia gladioli TaxID=28095 RepID=UPI00163EFB0B|nr:hypothetical protein [Burkholderia gladioli]